MKRITSERGLSTAQKGARTAVLFHATWCPYCRAFRPVFKEIMEGARRWTPVDATIDDQENPLWEKYAIEAVPTVIFFDDGKIVKRLNARPGVGLAERELRRALKKS